MSTTRPLLLLAIASAAMSCTTSNPDYCDEDKPCTEPGTTCDLAGDFGPANQCTSEAFDAAPRIDAPTEGRDATPPVDAPSPDTPLPDAAQPATQFDIAYVDQLIAGSSTTFYSSSQLVRVANTGSATLDLSTAAVTNVVADDGRWTVNVNWNPLADGTINPGNSGGALSAAAATLIVDSGLMSEPPEDIAHGYLSFSLSDGPASGSWLGLNVDVTLAIEAARVNLRFKLVASGGGTTVTPSTTKRVSSTPL